MHSLRELPLRALRAHPIRAFALFVFAALMASAVFGGTILVQGIRGGLATVGVDYYNLGRIAGEMGADILEGKAKPQDMAIRYQSSFKAKINATAAKDLGITIPETLAKDAQIVNY